jgi:hypothetical protein
VIDRLLMARLSSRNCRQVVGLIALPRPYGKRFYALMAGHFGSAADALQWPKGSDIKGFHPWAASRVRLIVGGGLLTAGP